MLFFKLASLPHFLFNKKNILLLLFLLNNFFCAFSQKAIPKYYDNINFNLNGKELKIALANLITQTHKRQLTYGQIWQTLKITDKNPRDTKKVVLLYGWENGNDNDFSNDLYRDNNQNGGKPGEWNREHTYAQSLGSPALGKIGAGADAHHLRACDSQRNSKRGNKKFGPGKGNSKNIGGYWYPGDQWKGDVARMMMYLYLRYGTQCLPSKVGIGSTKNTPDGMIDLFLQWNAEDPVSEIEIQRNNYLSNLENPFAQGNRNPFIDNPYLATKIWGGPEAENTWKLKKTIQTDPFDFTWTFNPYNRNSIVINCKHIIKKITIKNPQGKEIKIILNPKPKGNKYELNNLPKGLITIEIESKDNKKKSQKITIK